MNEEKNVSPYRGVILSTIILIVVPILFYILFDFVLKECQTKFSEEMNHYTAIFFGFLCGFLFQMTCVITGLLTKSFLVVINRVKSFFEDLRISFKMAIKFYWHDIKENGIVFWIHFIVILFTLIMTIYGLNNAIQFL